jgi:hypothetical protein
VQLRWVELTGNAKPAQYHEEQGGTRPSILRDVTVRTYTGCANSRPRGGFRPVSLPLFHDTGRDLAIGEVGLRSFVVSRSYRRPSKTAMVRMPARCFTSFRAQFYRGMVARHDGGGAPLCPST